MNVQSSPSKSPLFAIRAASAPSEFFQNRDVAKKYFRRFGKVKLIMFKPKRQALVVEYSNEDSMLNALELAGEFHGKSFSVTREYSEIPVRKKRAKKQEDPDWIADPEVKAEVQAMGGYFPVTKTYDLRPEKMSVDSEQVEPAQLSKTKRKWKSSSPKPIQKKSANIDKSDLFDVIRAQARSAEDKYRILDARDKIIRLQLKRNEITKKSATIGTCPDMCPEKERLMREVQHQVALYEQETEGRGMNPKLAIKQYSRSSADQETPLPSELRPVNVLQMTMGYLMHEIMDLCETPDVNIAEWYHFLWDRTRGIRKDITQQELCCQGSVELLEQCARFHILCSARLVSEDPSVFDQKINTENLTKCLQTLKYMYHDLNIKNESCPNEPEFRSYVILLNLNDGNFMWEVQQLKREIQESSEVKFALEVYSSLDKNNYVKFFKLVQSTTYLNACILMRYFIQIRLSALKTLIKCYSPRVSQTSLPITYLTKILAFESTESTIEFLETYGLFTNVERTRVVLDRHNFSMPEYPYVLDRAIKLIESKRDQSIGHVVCGKELPAKIFKDHVPQNSFDEDGFLIDSDLLLDEPIKTITSRPETPITKHVFAKIEEEEVNISQTHNKPFWVTATTSASTFQKNIFTGEVIPAKIEKSEEQKKLEAENQRKLELEEELKKRRLEEEEIKQRIEEKRRQAELEKQILEEKLKKLEAEAAKRRLLEAEERRKRIEEEQREQKLLEEEAKRKKHEEDELKRKQLEEIRLRRDVKDTVEHLINRVEKQLKTEILEKIRNKIKSRRTKRVLDKWREYSRRNRKRKALDFSPSFASARTVEEEARELKTKSQDLTLASIKRYKLGSPLEIFTDLDSDTPKIDLSDLTFKILSKRFLELTRKVPKEIFWKISISLPDAMEFKFGLNFLEKVLDDYLGWNERYLIQQSKTDPCITYCLEKHKGALCVTKSDSNGYLFVADRFNETLCERILNCLKNFGLFTKIPIVLALQRIDDLDRTKLNALIDQGVVSDYLIIVDDFNSRNIVNIIEESLIFLATRLEKPPPLQLDTLKSFLSKYLIGDLWKRANSFAKWNSNYKNCLKNPNTVIYLYNEALDRLKTIVLNRACAEYAKFPEVFRGFLRSEIPDYLPCDYRYFPGFWCHKSYFEHLEAALDNIKIPKFVENWPPKDQASLEASLKRYCRKLFRNENSLKVFYKCMGVLLRNIENFEDVRNVVWSDVVELIGVELLNQQNFSLYGTGFVNQSVFNQLTVVYDVSTLNEFVKSDWFYVNHPLIKHKIVEMLQKITEEISEEEEEEVFDLDVDQMLDDLMKTPRKKDATRINTEIGSCKNLLNDLEDTIVVHKRILEKSGGILKKLVENK